MKGKERLSTFPFRPPWGDWRRKRVWNGTRGRKISVRTQSWTDTLDGIIHAPLGPTATETVPTDTRYTHTHGQANGNVIFYQIPHSPYCLHVHKYILTDRKRLPFQTRGEAKLLPQRKRNYSPTAVKEEDIFIDFYKIMKFLWENLTYCQAWLKSAVSCIFCTDIDGKLERINVKSNTLLHGTHNKISQNI